MISTREASVPYMVKETFNHDFVFLTDWSITVRPFYHMRYADNPKLTKSFDLIANGHENYTPEHSGSIVTMSCPTRL